MGGWLSFAFFFRRTSLELSESSDSADSDTFCDVSADLLCSKQKQLLVYYIAMTEVTQADKYQVELQFFFSLHFFANIATS